MGPMPASRTMAVALRCLPRCAHSLAFGWKKLRRRSKCSWSITSTRHLLKTNRIGAAKFRSLGRSARAELDIHPGILLDLHFAAACEHTGIHGPREAVVAERHPDIAGTLRHCGAQHSESRAASESPSRDVGVAGAAGVVMVSGIVIGRAAGQH